MKEKKPRVDSEAATRKSILKSALYFYGTEGARYVQMHFDKYDRILAACGNESERNHIKQLAIVELHQMMRFKDGLNIGGKDVLPPLEDSKK